MALASLSHPSTSARRGLFIQLACALILAAAGAPAVAAPFTASLLPPVPADELLSDGKVARTFALSGNGAWSAGTVLDPSVSSVLVSTAPSTVFPGDTVSTFHNPHTEAFLRRDGQLERFGIASMQGNAAVAVNDRGLVLGQATDVTTTLTGSVGHGGPSDTVVTASLAFLYDKGTLTLLGQNSRATALNASGQAVGSAEGQAFLYSNGQLQTIGPLGSSAVALNDMGQVIGHVFANGGQQSFLYANGQTTMLGVPGMGGDAVAIANNGEVVLNVPVQNGDWLAASIPFLYKDGHYTEVKLDNVKDAIGAEAHGINAQGMVAGLMRTAAHESKGFLYADGQLNDLDSLVDPALGLHFIDALKVDELGRVTAVAQTGEIYLLSAVPEAGSMAMSMMGLLAMALIRRARSNSGSQHLQ